MRRIYDLLIVGAGPAGLALAQYAATRGHSVKVFDERSYPGGRAATSPLLENVPGFPDGIAGREFGERLKAQAERLGAEVTLSTRIKALSGEGSHIAVMQQSGSIVRGRFLVLACGLSPRHGQLDLDPKLEGVAVHYEPPESYEKFAGQDVAIYGGGNAAGQTALAFSRAGANVFLFMREHGIGESMATYLADRIKEASEIAVRNDAQISRVSLKADDSLELRITKGVYWSSERLKHLFVILSGEPQNTWLPHEIRLDRQGYIETDCSKHRTSNPRIFAIGDACSCRGNSIMAAYGDAAGVFRSIFQ